MCADSKSLSYPQAVKELLGLVNYEVKPPPMRFDTQGWHLEAFGTLLKRLGCPAAKIPTVHVAGTKGKGSVSRLTMGLLRAAGLERVGLFTSPHISSFRERMAVNGQPISKQDFAEVFAKVRSVQSGENSEGFRTTFETLTAMGLVYFQKMGCDAIVLETGLGGRLDATNVPPSQLAVITAIGFDHQRVLGNRLRDIAREKAGIIKAGVRDAVLGPQSRGRMRIVSEVARREAITHGVQLHCYETESDPLGNIRADEAGFLVDIRRGTAVWRDVRFPFLGRHQLDNFRTALAAVDCFCERQRLDELRETAVRKVLGTLVLPGKLERVCEEPLAIVDAAHCPASSLATARAVNEHFGKPEVTLLMGILGDKNLRTIIKNLTGLMRCRRVLVYAPPTPRALEVSKVADALEAVGAQDVSVCDSAEEAVRHAISNLKKGELLLATGSTYGIAPVTRALADCGCKVRLPLDG